MTIPLTVLPLPYQSGINKNQKSNVVRLGEVKFKISYKEFWERTRNYYNSYYYNPYYWRVPTFKKDFDYKRKNDVAYVIGRRSSNIERAVDKLKTIIKNIVKENVIQNKYFEFSPSKND